MPSGEAKKNLREVYRRLIEHVYAQCNPEKIGDVPGIMQKYKRQEPEIFDKVVRKYIFSAGEKYWRPVIESAYRRFNPAKMVDLPAILQKYHESEAALYRAVCDKYLPGVRVDDPTLLELVHMPSAPKQPLGPLPVLSSQSHVDQPLRRPSTPSRSSSRNSSDSFNQSRKCDGRDEERQHQQLQQQQLWRQQQNHQQQQEEPQEQQENQQQEQQHQHKPDENHSRNAFMDVVENSTELPPADAQLADGMDVGAAAFAAVDAEYKDFIGATASLAAASEVPQVQRRKRRKEDEASPPIGEPDALPEQKGRKKRSVKPTIRLRVRLKVKEEQAEDEVAAQVPTVAPVVASTRDTSTGDRGGHRKRRRHSDSQVVEPGSARGPSSGRHSRGQAEHPGASISLDAPPCSEWEARARAVLEARREHDGPARSDGAKNATTVHQQTGGTPTDLSTREEELRRKLMELRKQIDTHGEAPSTLQSSEFTWARSPASGSSTSRYTRGGGESVSKEARESNGQKTTVVLRARPEADMRAKAMKALGINGRVA